MSDDVTIPPSMVPWHGGDSAPADWDGGLTLRRDGSLKVVNMGAYSKRWKRDIIAYTPRAAAPTPIANPALEPVEHHPKWTAQPGEEEARVFLLDRVMAQTEWGLPEPRAAVTLETAAAAMVAFARAYSTPSIEVREKIAQIINPTAFASWQSMFDYCLRQGDDEATARRYADDCHKEDCDKALAKADAILAALVSLQDKSA